MFPDVAAVGVSTISHQFSLTPLGCILRRTSVHTCHKAGRWKGYHYPRVRLFLRCRVTNLHTTLLTSSRPNERIACAIAGREQGCSQD